MKLSTTKNRSVIFAGTLLSVVLLALLASCAQQPVTSNGNKSMSISNTLAQTGTIALLHSPKGSANLSWQRESHILTVKISLTGLTPNSSHAAHIHAGDCSTDGAIVYPLTTIAADAKGNASSETTIERVQNGIPTTGWYIKVHNGAAMNGASMTPLEDRPIACGNVTPLASSQQGTQSAHVTLAETTAPNEAASGQAEFVTVNGKLTLKITMSGLEPNSQHVAHIHAGSCEAQGDILVMLNPVIADAKGHGTSTTLLDHMPSSAGGIYVNVHTGATQAELSQPTLFNPIACGNVQPT